MKAQLFKSTVKVVIAVAAVSAFANTSQASIFGKSKKKKAAEAAMAQQQLDYQSQQRAAYDQQIALEAQRRAADQQNYYNQQQAEYARQQRAYEAQLRAQQTYNQPTYAQPTYSQPQAAQPQQPRINVPPAALADTGVVGAAIDPAAPPSAKDLALKEFRVQTPQIMPFIITQAEWTPAIEAQYSRFIRQFGRGVKAKPMRTIKFYMRDPNSNMYASTDPEGIIYYSDCADLPYFLRSYFAYKNGLPMSIAAEPTMSTVPYASSADQDAKLGDLTKTESSPYGNIIGRRAASNIAKAPGREINYLDYWTRLMDGASTRTFRVSPLSPNYDLSDVYPVKIDRDNVRPGTIIHSEGHILVVTDIDAKGQVSLIDAHPDNSVQFKMLEPSKLARSRPDHGFGFFDFRPVKAVGGVWKTAPNGQQALYGANIVTASDAQLYSEGRWSLEQWFGPGSNVAPGSRPAPEAWKSGFKSINFFDFVRTQLGTTMAADESAGDLLTSLCDDMRQRVPDVEKPIEAGLTKQAHPSSLPANIFNSTGDWESFSSPSRDSRVREAIYNLPKLIAQKYQAGIRGQLKLTYSGTAQQFQQQIVNRIALMDASCKATYKKSDGTSVSMNFTDMTRRAKLMSLDPYECAEKRWGAQGAELATCRDQDPTGAWYTAQQSIRNSIGKIDANETYVVRSNQAITLQMLQSGRYVDQPASSSINLGSARSPIIDLKTYFSSPQFLQDLNR